MGTVTPSLEMTTVKPIAETIANNFGGASVWTLDSAKIAENAFAFRGMCHADEWRAISADAVCLSSEALEETGMLVTSLKYLEVQDFDDHLSDPSANWLNPQLFKGESIADLP